MSDSASALTTRAPSVRLRRGFLTRATRSGTLIVGVVLVLVTVLLALFANVLTPFNPTTIDFMATWQGPSSEHLLGTDNLGRDVLSRALHGARVSLTVGLGSQLIVLLIGVLLGALAGYFGGRTDTVIMRITDVALAFPDLLLIILFMTVFKAGIWSMIIAIGLAQWPGLARLVRGTFLALREGEMVEAARAIGLRHLAIAFRHVLPNSLAPIIVHITFGVPAAIMAEAGLSYIGIGINPPTPSWGLMINEGFSAIQSFPHLIAVPAGAIAITMLGFVLLGNGLQDVLDVRTGTGSRRRDS